jgi:hypothetical protein
MTLPKSLFCPWHNVGSTTENSTDNEIEHDNEVPHVHVDAMYSTEYNKGRGIQRWQVLKPYNGWYNAEAQNNRMML